MAERAHPDLPGFKDKWFGLKRSIYKERLFERYRFCNTYIKNKIVLDIPCGVGWGTTLLRGYNSTIGMDVSVEAIQYAKKHFERKNRKFLTGDMQAIALNDDSVDIIICLEGFEHVTKEIGEKFITESKRVLKQNGLLIMTCPVLNECANSTGNPSHLNEYPEQELIELLNKNFRIIKMERIKGPEGPEYRAVLINFKDSSYKDK